MKLMPIGRQAAATAAVLALHVGGAGCSDRTNGGSFPASPPAQARKNTFDNPPLGDPLSSNPADLKGFSADKAKPTRH